MKLIAHRGLINGPHKQFENQPHMVKTVLGAGFDCEIDLWVVEDRLFLGHDEPMYNVTLEFLQTGGLWIHAKSLNTLHWLTKCNLDLNYFWHENDSYTVTSKGYIWAYPGRPLTNNCVMVMPEWHDAKLEHVKDIDCYGVCSDYVGILK